MTVYLLNTDTLIRAKNEHYGFDLSWLLELARQRARGREGVHRS